ncbi:Uncharacterised protein [Mycobacteroides abscessus subsp. abscessus]|nr:Uncharacterised protein [Mycobacteroides abscessus subsp. abscessus]
MGYYPNDIRAQDYELKADEGHSYAHHLFLEQSMRHVKEGGYLFLIVPNGCRAFQKQNRSRESLSRWMPGSGKIRYRVQKAWSQTGSCFFYLNEKKILMELSRLKICWHKSSG